MTIPEKFAALIAKLGSQDKKDLGVALVADDYGWWHPQLVSMYPADEISETPTLQTGIYTARGDYGNALLPALNKAARLANALGIMDPHDVAYFV